MYGFIHRVAPSVMVPELMLDFNLSAQGLGNLSAAYFYVYALLQIPIGLMLDKYSSRYLLTFSAAMITIASFIFSKTDNIFTANICRAIIGFGSAFGFVACLKLAVNWIADHKFGLIVGLTNLFGEAGAVVGGKPLAHLVNIHDWRYTIQLATIIGAAFVVLLWLIIRDKPSAGIINAASVATKFQGSANKPTNNFANNANINEHLTTIAAKLKVILKNKQVWLIALIGSLIVVPIASYSELWGTPYIMNKYNLTTPMASQIVSFTFIGVAIGSPVNGYISDVLNKRKPVLLLGILGALATVTSIIYINDLSILNLTLLHIILGFFCSSMLLCFTLNAEITPHYAQGTAMGFTNMLVAGVGVIAQVIIGYILDRLAENHVLKDMTEVNNVKHLMNMYLPESFQIALIPVILSLICAIIIWTQIKEAN